MCNEAALIAARNGKEAIDANDFEAAVDRIIGGKKRSPAPSTHKANDNYSPRLGEKEQSPHRRR